MDILRVTTASAFLRNSDATILGTATTEAMNAIVPM